MKLIKQVQVYNPQPMGVKDILISEGKIVAIEDQIQAQITGVEIEEIDGQYLIVAPGFIDAHFHILGGGGENGFMNRTPEVTLTDLTTAGVTTVCGLLGTDGVGRHDAGLLSKAHALEFEGVSTYAYIGNYRLPVETLTKSIIDDIMLIDKVIGIGEIAIADHRNGAPTFEQFAHACADARVGGLLSGKAGVVNIHVGPGKSKLDLIFECLEKTDIPISTFYPTHIGRSQALIDEALKFAEMGGVFDITAAENPDQFFELDGEIPFRKILRQVLDKGLDPKCITLTSDGQGSLPIFDDRGNFIEMGVASARALLVCIKEAVQRESIPLEIALQTVTSNVADILKLPHKGRIQVGKDADLVFLDPDSLDIQRVIAKGQVMVEDGRPVKFGVFEKRPN
ncbi:beta-aspartyl-peptidase [Vaginisenegalia massiliensis]|uniref:beta-aspartyl-peptidase n=1 Tax=Vaginisenegalia massiliensis TaxID=2058294 RepID=UPI000F54428B|nr:beta-aspartyl-peptidase [Vaginisenegalia massiliensis]